MTDPMNYTKGDWKAGYNPNVTGPTTPGIQLFCGGRDWPYKTVNVGEETIAIVPAQIYKRTKIGKLSEHLIDGGMANARLIAAAPDMYEALKVFKRDGVLAALDLMDAAIAKAEGK